MFTITSRNLSTTLIERVNAAYGDSQKSVIAEFQPQFAAAKGNEKGTQRVRTEAQAKLESELARKLDGILNAQQKIAMAAAAEEERGAPPKRQPRRRTANRHVAEIVGH